VDGYHHYRQHAIRRSQPLPFPNYSVLVDTMRLGALYRLVSELQALAFRSFSDWLVLLLVLGAAFVMDRVQKVSLFWLLLFWDCFAIRDRQVECPGFSILPGKVEMIDKFLRLTKRV
jgi:hypothetical protein